MRQCYSHDQLFGITRELCERHGWKVSRGKNRGEESKGSLTIGVGSKAIAFPYRLPMLVDVWEKYVRGTMEALDLKQGAAPSIAVQEAHA